MWVQPGDQNYANCMPSTRIDVDISKSLRLTVLALSMEKLCDRSGNELTGKTTKFDAE